MSEGKYDRSLTDLMAGVAVVFLLMAVIFILKANQRAQAAEKAIDPIKAQKELVTKSLDDLSTSLTLLNDSMDGGFIALDGGVNSLEITFKRLDFEIGKCGTPRDFEEQLLVGGRPLVSSICRAVETIRDAGAACTIVLEGHTDARRFEGVSGECGVFDTRVGSGFDNNVRASAARAQSVFFSMRRAVADAGADAQCLDANFVVSGRGQAVPSNPLDPKARENRRTIIRVRGDLTSNGAL